MRNLATLAPLALILAACSPERPPIPIDRPEEREPEQATTGPATGSALQRKAELADLVVVATIERRLEEPGGVFYEAELREVLRTREGGGTHPRAVGTRIRLSSFLYRSGQGLATIGSLDELGRYLLFLSPAERPGEWLNLEDAAVYSLPEAQRSLDELRRLRDAERKG